MEAPEHHSSEPDGSLPILQRGFASQVHKLLGTNKLIIELESREREREYLYFSVQTHFTGLGRVPYSMNYETVCFIKPQVLNYMKNNDQL